jgi:hypothetical protein
MMNGLVLDLLCNEEIVWGNQAVKVDELDDRDHRQLEGEANAGFIHSTRRSSLGR